MEERKELIQVIRHKCCNKIYAMCIEPHCYTDTDWQKEVRKSVKAGDKVEMLETATFERCTCNQQQQDPNQLSLI